LLDYNINIIVVQYIDQDQKKTRGGRGYMESFVNNALKQIVLPSDKSLGYYQDLKANFYNIKLIIVLLIKLLLLELVILLHQKSLI
jgi:hypothetical protein